MDRTHPLFRRLENAGKRGDELRAAVAKLNEGPLYSEHLREIYTTILKVMKEAPSL